MSTCLPFQEALAAYPIDTRGDVTCFSGSSEGGGLVSRVWVATKNWFNLPLPQQRHTASLITRRYHNNNTLCPSLPITTTTHGPS